MMRPLRLPLLCALALVGLTLAPSCSIRRYQGADNILYTGIKSISIEGDKRSAHAQQAIAQAEAQLEHAPNNAIFGSSTMRWPIPLIGPWLYLRHSPSKGWPSSWLHRLGSRPVWVSDVSPTLRARVAEKLLAEQGYLAARATSQLHHQRGDSLRARVAYSISLGELYRLDSVEHLPPFALGDSLELRHSDLSILRRGEPFALDKLSKDRTTLVDALREQGYYYFAPDYIRYEADTLASPGAVQLRTRLADGLVAGARNQWRIGRVRVRFLDPDSYGQTLATDTLELQGGVVALYSGKIPIRPRILNTRIRLRPDSLYRYRQESLTLKSLASIGTFTGTEIQYTPTTPPDSLEAGEVGTMDMTILMRRDKPWDVSVGSRFMFKSTDFIGPGLSASLSRRNLFGGGETLSISASGSYEWQTGTNPFRDYSLSLNSYNLSLDASLTVPTLLIPGRLGVFYDFPTTTTLKLAAQRMNRAGYYSLNSLSLSATYDFTPQTGHTHSFTPVSLSYNYLGNTSESFKTILEQNPSLGLSLMSQLIPQMSYAYTRDKAVGSSHTNRLWYRLGLSQAGNLTKAILSLAGYSYGRTQSILKVPFAQFVKATGEVRYTYMINRYQRLALRLGLGAIYSYGNALRAPYMEQFFVGGANSIRAFTVRSIGPGAFRSTSSSAYTFMDHVGETKLEMNAEWRMKLAGSLEGALFVDAGNIWLLRRDADRPEAALSEVRSLGRFLDQIAVGTGAGLRYDLTYLVVRLDVGIGLHLPYQTSRSGWYNIPRFSDALGIHLAIGYPF